MSLDFNSGYERIATRPGEGSDSVDWSSVYRTEIAPVLSSPNNIAAAAVNVTGNRLPEISPVVQAPVMYAQVTELPSLTPPTAPLTATDAAPARPPRITVPELADAVSTLQAAQQPNTRLPFQIQVFLAREVGMAALTDAFVDRGRGADPPARPGHCDAAIAALQVNLGHMREGTGHGWQIEAAITQGLLGFAQLHRSGIGERLNATTVGASQQAGGDRARFANNGLQNLFDARQNLERLLNPPPGTAALPEAVRAELRSILSTLPRITSQNGQLRLTGDADSEPLMQIGMRHSRQAIAGFRR